MYSVSEAYLKAINADTRDMPYRVKIDGVMLDQSMVTKMTLTESASGNNGVSIGTANSASLTLSLKKATPKDYNDVEIEPESGIVLPKGETEWVPLGKFWVTDFKTSNDFEDLSLTCADGMYLLRNEYESKLAYPTTLKDFVREICDDTGVEFEDFDSIPDDPDDPDYISLRLKPDKMTYRNAIGYAAGCCGKNARFNRSGKLEFFWYEDTGVTIGRKTQYMNGMTKLSQDEIEVGIEVEGREELYSVEVISGGGGGATATPGEKVKEGETVSVSISPSFEYELYSLSVRDKNGGEITTDRNSSNNYEFTQKDGNSTVTVAFKDLNMEKQKVNLYAYDGGVITKNNAFERYEEGATVIFFVSLEEGYNVDRIVAAPANLVITPNGITEDLRLVYVFTMPPCEVSVSFYFKKDAVAQQRYTMSRSSTSNKKITLTYENPLISEKVQEVVQSHVQDFSYTPAKVKHRGNPALQAGDVVFVTDKDGIDHKIPILQQTLNFGGGMNSEISAPGETENKQTFSSNGPFSTQIKKEVQKSVEEVERRLSSSNSLAFSSLSKVIGENEAKVQSLVEWKEGSAEALSKVENRVTATEAEITSLAKFKTDTESSLAKIESSASDLGARIDLIVEEEEYKNFIGENDRSMTIVGENNFSYQEVATTTNLKENRTYMFSADVVVNKSNALFINKIGVSILRVLNSSVVGDPFKLTFIIENGRISGRFVYSDFGDGDTKIRIYPGINGVTKGNEITLSNIKLVRMVTSDEEVVKADLALEIKTDSNGEKYSQLTANAGKMVFNAGQFEVNADNFSISPDGKLSCIETNASGVQSKVVLSANGITLYKKKEGVWKEDKYLRWSTLLTSSGDPWDESQSPWQ